MKIRSDFVTNSSSSSFICDFCGNQESGWDMCLSEAEMMQCENGHTICEDHIEISDDDWKDIVTEYIQSNIQYCKDKINKYKDDPIILQRYESELKEYEEQFNNINDMDICELKKIADNYEFEYNLPSKYCPLCNFTKLTDNDMKNYLLKKYERNEKIMMEEIRSEFKNYDEFKNYIKGKNNNEN